MTTKTWFNVFPIFLAPFGLSLLPGLIPPLAHVPALLQGASFRVWCVDRLVLPLLSDASAWDFSHWYQAAPSGARLWLHVLICLNLTVLCAPSLYGIGSAYLRVHNGLVLAQFQSKRKAAQQ
jgi:hypothetical protein